MATKAKKEELFDPDILAVIRAEAGVHKPDEDGKVATPVHSTTPRKLPTTGNLKPLSKVFGWEPVLGIDIPVPVFKDTDWPEEVRPFIPSVEELEGYVPYPKLIEQFIAGMFHEDRILLHGPTGPGKSTLPKFICSVLRIPYLLDNGHTEKEKSEFVGINTFKIDPKSGKEILAAEDTMWTLAFKHGGMMVYDEAFRTPPGVNMVIQAAMERGGSLVLQDAAGLEGAARRLKPPDSMFWFVLTDNSVGTGDSTGNFVAQTQDVSTLDRITSTIFVDYLPAKFEEQIIKRAEPSLSEKATSHMVSLANLIRAAFNKGSVTQTMSVRGLLSWANKSVTYGDLNRGYIMAFYDKLGTREEKDLAEEMWHQVFATQLEV